MYSLNVVSDTFLKFLISYVQRTADCSAELAYVIDGLSRGL